MSSHTKEVLVPLDGETFCFEREHFWRKVEERAFSKSDRDHNDPAPQRTAPSRKSVDRYNAKYVDRCCINRKSHRLTPVSYYQCQRFCHKPSKASDQKGGSPIAELDPSSAIFANGRQFGSRSSAIFAANQFGCDKIANRHNKDEDHAANTRNGLWHKRE